MSKEMNLKKSQFKTTRELNVLAAHLSLAQVLQDLVRTAAQDILFAEHNSRHHPIFTRYKPLLQIKRLLVPGNDSTAKLKCLADTERTSIADGRCPNDHVGPQSSYSLEHTIAGIQRETGKVTLAQVACIVHVAKVNVMENDSSANGLLCCDVKYGWEEPGPDQHNHCP